MDKTFKSCFSNVLADKFSDQNSEIRKSIEHRLKDKPNITAVLNDKEKVGQFFSVFMEHFDNQK